MIGEATALHHAAGRGHCEVVEVLTTSGAEPNPKNRWGDTPLHTSAYYDRPEAIEKLVKHGADMVLQNNRVRRRRTHPLH